MPPFTRRSLLALAGQALAASAAGPGPAADLGERFRRPTDADKPWAYWWWVNGNVTRRSITRDLEQMKQKGIGGFLMFDSRRYGEDILPPPPPAMAYMSDEWRDLLRFAMSEAARLGLEMSMNLSTTGGALRSPWETGADAPKKLVWTSAEARGPGRVTCRLRPPEKGHFWEAAVIAVRHAGHRDSTAAGAVDLSGQWRDIVLDPARAPALAEVVDLTSRVDAQGYLAWDMPEGCWSLLRFACATMEGYENDVDILNALAVAAHFERMAGPILADAGPLAGKTLTHFYNVSWEGASPTWTPGFETDFLKFRGYDPRPYLPVLAGLAVTSSETSGRFLEDYSRTLSDCFQENCYGHLGGLCHRAGLKWRSESGGPWDREKTLFARADQLAFWGRNDMPQGEFWHPEAGRTNCRRAAMAAHIYGRPRVAAESFTNMVEHWSDYPAVLKPRGDAALIDGINHFIWHTFDASPDEFGKPGIVYFAGSHLNPNVTWWECAGAFLTYLGRCQLMLRQGRFVADVCVYTGDRTYSRWDRGERWSEHASLAPGKGCAYDVVNTEVLVERLSVGDGGLVLPGGMRYRILVVDLEEEAVPPEALRKIVELARNGATVVLGRRRAERAPGLKDAAVRDAEVRRIAGELWRAPGDRRLERGTVISGRAVDEVLRAEGCLPDFEGPFEYIHRYAEDADIYFVTGQGQADCAFRVGAQAPELWDPVSGRVRDAVRRRTSADGRTIVSVSLPENGSVFVVFRRPAARRGATAPSGRPTAAAPKSMPLDGPWQVRFAPGWGAPASAVFERLIAWDRHPDDGIRYFSGSAVYRKRFSLDPGQAQRPLRLQLGEVKHVARVRVNGKEAGIVWTAPWTADLSGLVSDGANQLEIEVTNTWVNRLIGDAGLPEEQRLTKTIVRRRPEDQGRYPHLRGYLAGHPLATSGLLGPVRLEFGEE